MTTKNARKEAEREDARSELHKRQVTVYSVNQTCKWCGSARLRYRGGKPVSSVLFEFWNESDGGRKYNISGQFCSVSCMRSYHG